ncbi:hypothetical protein H4R20_002701 [Coemansia guatemalensis]|uniref:SWIM-type domain-containing protein n=1 Tax=Coemansia guatemalensis TaxID=2761395 RepID=A0A9W8HV07_9FUNG|nr:hypothetical protein H4R20_002701 [Coemansia guatemalensis]
MPKSYHSYRSEVHNRPVRPAFPTRPGIRVAGVEEVFYDTCILQLVERDEGAPPPKPSPGGGYTVTIPGLCPFHVIAEKQANGTTICGGIQSHVHEKAPSEIADNKVVTKGSLVLKIPLVTQPVPFSVLLSIPDLRRIAVYFHRDSALSKESSSTSDIVTERLTMHTLAKASSFKVNPACRRMLQWMAEEKLWKLDESSQFSIDSWSNVIGHENILLFSRGMRVPYPHNQKFRASSNIYRIAIGFWSQFQQQMWESFLESDIEECFLDASFRCDQDGFQLWTLLYERDGQTIPISYLLTTATTVKLVADWLSALIDQSQEPLPKKVIYINTLKAKLALEHVFPGWDVCFNKYYIDQELKSLVLRRKKKDLYDPHVVSAIQNIDENFTDAIRAVRNTPDLENEVDYILSQAESWNPTSYKQLERFNKSSGVVCRWRYFLWMALLSRPAARRIDPMIYFLVSILTPGVEQAVSAQKGGSQGSGNFSMDSLEQGGKSPEPGFDGMRMKPLGDSLICLIPKTHSGKYIVDRKFSVCYCSKFIQKGICKHLIYASTMEIHQPWLVKLLDDIPNA